MLLTVAIASAGLIHVSIAGSQILLGFGILLLLVFRRGLRFPRIWLPLLLFFVWTMLSDALSPDPWGGYPQIKKFFVFMLIPLLYGVFSEQFENVYYLVVVWTAAATASGIWGLVQFVLKYEHAKHTGENFYLAYVARRITGFESHWMTFGALQLSVLCIVIAHLFFSNRRMPAWAYGSIPILSAAILLGWTRSIWIATIPAVLYLVWFWNRKMVALVPLIAVLALLVAPASTRSRLVSLVSPHGDIDSNEHRAVLFWTGLRMIEAHPWFGLGPEQIGRKFNSYVPPGTPRPLPTGFYGHLHNIYTQYAAERGIPALLLMLWLIGEAVWDWVQGIRRLGRKRSQQLFVLHGCIACTIAIMVGGLGEFNLGDSEVLMMFVSVMAIGYAALRSTDFKAAV
ncbi:MAG TPA: O-antigen ligase family protein [Bryobacteraceae bacterium]|nr:O-antigen ligase family protein [Bryobacteraceae bacterium]